MRDDTAGGHGMTWRWMIVAGLAVLAMAVGNPRAHAQTAPAPAPSQPGASADDNDGDLMSDIALTRAAIQVRRQALVTAAMDLDEKEAQAFWPLYRDYRQSMAKVNDRTTNLVVSYLGAYDNLSDDAAKRMLDEYLRIEKERNAVKTKYLSRFRKIMPERKVARFYQVENKLDAFMNAELAQMIPLAR
jgi:hypothetical protein